jgi:hypothetical protein
MTTKEQAADQIASRITNMVSRNGRNPFIGMSAARISAILQFGATKEEFKQMLASVENTYAENIDIEDHACPIEGCERCEPERI